MVLLVNTLNFQPHYRVQKMTPSETQESESKCSKLGEKEEKGVKDSCWLKIGHTTLTKDKGG